MIDPGSLRDTLILEAPVETPDGQGGVTRAFATLATIKAKIAPQSGETKLIEGHLTQVNSLRITLRPVAGLTAAHRFRQGARLFRILSIEKADPLSLYLTCSCEEETP
jgi:head-tail adaptor